ncbi:TauD/TfdA family dioxygenase [uncultured Ruegeria sp.]|uniref:TauD/TfdA family dioxygenase n=1 Tax=uncultured Ruegeria sp. TaxID=259304 RepID=UPI00261F8095|nr:TauD/TfdA family dioxygenase [uncultured Ruegeria sp.]
MTRWQDCQWRAIWPNPEFIASHAFAIEGIGHHEGQTLLDNAITFCTQPEQVYSHQRSVGNVLIWDERATMHRGRLWN